MEETANSSWADTCSVQSVYLPFPIVWGQQTCQCLGGQGAGGIQLVPDLSFLIDLQILGLPSQAHLLRKESEQ